MSDAAAPQSGEGPASPYRSVSRTQPMSTDRAACTAEAPSTISVEPPPRSTTRNGSGCRPVSSPVAPAKDRAASSEPGTTSGSTPRADRTPSTKSCRLRASRVAEVATNRSFDTPAAAQRTA